MKRQHRRWGVQGLVLAGAACLVLIMVFLLTFRLDTLFTGISTREAAVVAEAGKGAQNLLEHPVSLPQKSILFVLHETELLNSTSLRLVSVGFCVAAIGLFYIFVRSRFSTRISLLGSLAFSSSSLYLAIARNGSYMSSTLFATCALLAASQLFSHPKGFAGKGWLIGVLVALALFSPGVIVLFILLSLWYIRQTIQSTKVWPMTALLPAFALPAISLAIISYGFYRDSAQVTSWLGLPNSLPGLHEYGRHMLDASRMLFFQASPQPEFFLARTPILDIFTTVCFVVGLAYVQQRSKLQNFLALTVLTSCGIAYLALQNPVEMLPLILPVTFLSVTAGITMLLRQWLEIFPRNPFARTVGVAIMTIVVGISCFYQMNRYFVAFSQTPENRRVFANPLIISSSLAPSTPTEQPGSQ